MSRLLNRIQTFPSRFNKFLHALSSFDNVSSGNYVNGKWNAVRPLFECRNLYNRQLDGQRAQSHALGFGESEFLYFSLNVLFINVHIAA